ncbi:MAG: 4Fe-4S binding protein [Bacteroidales bacterium]|jgi:NAD-dependent dihydropyrimidine dehydrogenase PreA subunit|nr:4Fe-4S binding protein [Bacteroidales bacterium]
MMKVGRIILLLLLLAIVVPVLANAQDSSPLLEKCQSCVYAVGGKAPSTSSVLLKMAGVVAVIVLATLFGWFTYHKKRYIFFGAVATLLVIGSYVFAIEKYINREYPVQSCDSTICITDSLNAAPTVDSLNPFVADEFLPAAGEFEYLSEFTTASDDEFSEFPQPSIDKNLLYQTIVLLMLSAIIGLIIKYRLVRNSRGLILLASIIYLGFVRGACPCMIMSLHQVILFMLGNPVPFISMLWFLGLVVATYFFGKTWCGWLCHLGALQDVIFRSPGRKWLATEKSQRMIKYIQSGLLVVLIVQLVITRSIIFVKYDPFKVAYNLFSSNITGYILLVLLLVSSVLIYRPFCRTACPVGLLLGWATKIPGAKKLVVESGCNNCKSCVRSCKQQAIHSVDGKIKINTEDCILCGDCIGTCKKSLLSVKRNSI